MFSYPFDSLPPLECHISPPLVEINGPKLGDLDQDAISLIYHGQESNETQVATKESLILLYSVWDPITCAKILEKNWRDHKCMDRIKEWVEATTVLGVSLNDLLYHRLFTSRLTILMHQP